MAALSRGVVERENTIIENRKALNELMKRNEFDEPSQKELNKLFKRLNHSNASSNNVKDMKSYEPAWHEKKITNRCYGPIPGIPPGSWWGIRMDCSRDRMHDPFSASVQSGPVGAVSICTSHSNEDIDLGDFLTFTCQPHDGVEDATILRDNEISIENRSLILNFENRVPVRVIRSYDLLNEYSPKTGYRYDGLYMVVRYWIAVSLSGDTRCYKFALRRLFHQERPPWKSEIPRDTVIPVPALKRYSKNSNLQDQGGTIGKMSSANVRHNETLISRRIFRKRFPKADENTTKVVESNSDALQSSSVGVQESHVFPSCKISSTDHKNVKISTIVTRRVSKKFSNNIVDNKFTSDCGVNKLWNMGGGNESQVIEDDEGLKSQNTRLQNTNISIRTDLYDSSHNLKQNLKKCGSSSTHGVGNFKPRVLNVPRRELHFAGVDSSPGSSRTISSVKMERVKGSVDNQINKRNLNHILCQHKTDTAVNPTTCKSDGTVSPVAKTVPSTVEYSCKNLEDMETEKNRFSYPCGNETEESREAENRNEENNEESSTSQRLELKNIEDKSLSDRSLPPSPPFKGFLSTERSPSGMEVSWAESSAMMSSLTLEKMLDIITEEKSSPIAKMIISNVIGVPTFESPQVFQEAKQLHLQPITNVQRKDSNDEARLRENETANSSGTETLSIIAFQNSRELQTENLGNSGQREIIDTVYSGEKDEESVKDICNSTAGKNRLILAVEEGDKRIEDRSMSGSKKNSVAIRRYGNPRRPKAAECGVTKCHSEHESQSEKNYTERSVVLRVQTDQESSEGLLPGERIRRISGTDDTAESCDNNKIYKSKLATMKDSELSKSSDEKIICEKTKARIITRSKYLQKSTESISSRLDVANNENSASNRTTEIADSEKLSNEKTGQLRSKSSDKIRLRKRCGVKVKRRLEIANLFIDMNMSPRSQLSKSKLRSKRSSQDAELRRRSCPAVVNRSLKRSNDDSENNSTIAMKRMRKVVKSTKSSVQEKGLSLRERRRNENSLSNNNHNNNNNNNNKNSNNNNISVRRVGKAEKVITNIKKTIKSTARSLLKNKNKNVNGIRKPVEIPKRRETAEKNCSGRSLRSITVGRIGLRRALLNGTEAYARKKKKKKEKQKQTTEKATQPAPKKKLIEFALNKAKLDYKIYKGDRNEEGIKKPKMISVMTQCSIIPETTSQNPVTLPGRRRLRRNVESNSYRGSELGSDCISRSQNSSMDRMKNEIIELIELKSEPFDDDVVPCGDEDIRMAENNSGRNNGNSVFNSREIISTQVNEAQSQTRLSSRPFSDLRRYESARKTGFIRYVAGPRTSAFVPVKSVDANLLIAQLKSIGFKPIKPGVFPTDCRPQTSSDTPRINYSSAVVKRGVHEEYDKYTSEENNVVQYMDSKLCYEDIENEDIIYGVYNEPSFGDMFVEKMEFCKLVTGEMEVEEEEEIEEQEEEVEEEEEEEEENEAPADDEEEEEEEEEEESKDNFVLLQEEDEEDEESSSKVNLKTWQSQIEDNSSNSENADQGVIDSDGDVPWHGWRKIISNKETHFVGW